jgi:hypothetical protein
MKPREGMVVRRVQAAGVHLEEAERPVSVLESERWADPNVQRFLEISANALKRRRAGGKRGERSEQ